MDVSSNIKAVRASKGMSQAEVARRLELDPSAYFRLENRGNKLSIEQVDSIAKVLGVELLALLTWGDDTPIKPDAVEVGKLERDLAKSDELLKYQREKIEYMQAACVELIIEMAAINFDGRETIEDPDTGEIDFIYPEKEWKGFLSEFLFSDDWAYELLERGIVDEKAIMAYDMQSDSPAPAPKEIKRRQRKRQIKKFNTNAEMILNAAKKASQK